MKKIKVGVVGYKGRMGINIVNCILETDSTILSGAISSDRESEDIGLIFGKTIGINSCTSLTQLFNQSDVVIEFTNPNTMQKCLKTASHTNTALVSGTTGHNHHELLVETAKQSPVLWSANMSIGINMLTKLVKESASKLGTEYDIEILEMHHNKKQDAPSGTALMLGSAAAQGRSVDLSVVKNTERVGIRQQGDIGFASLRGGGVFGEHKVMFVAEDEYITLGHVSLTRNLFAKGAIKAALWLYNQKNNLYSMQDVINE